MGEYLSFMIYALFILSIFLVVCLPIYKKHEKVTGGIVNYDPTMRKFVYKVNMSGEEIIRSLKIINVQDDLSCTFNLEKNTIIFSDLRYKYEYYYEIQEYDGFSILKLSRASFSLDELKPSWAKYRNYYYAHPKGDIHYRLNPFMVSKINAEIIPFSQYGN